MLGEKPFFQVDEGLSYVPFFLWLFVIIT